MQMMCCRTHKRGAGGFLLTISQKKTQSHLLKVTLWVGAAGRPADGGVPVAGTLLTGVRPP